VSVPFDHTFKLLSDDDPRAAMAAFAGIPLDVEMEVRPLDRELNVTTLRVDHLYRCRQGAEEFLIHFEAVSRYRGEVLDRQVDYLRAIISKYKLPRRVELAYGDYSSQVRLRTVRLWRIPARRVLAMGRPALLPWTALAAATPADLATAARRLVVEGNRALALQMALLMGLRYGKKEVFEQRLERMTTEEILEDSYFYHWIIEKGERKLITRLLTSRFGELPAWAVQRLKDAEDETLTRYGDQLLTATTLEDALR